MSASSKQDAVIVIGGGIAGVSTLYELLARGIPAKLYEAREGVALETSFANGGLLTPSMSDPWNGPGVSKQLAASVTDPNSPMKLHMSRLPGLALWGFQFLRNSSPERHRRATLANYRLGALSLDHVRRLKEQLPLSFAENFAGTMKVFDSPEGEAHAIAVSNPLRPEGMRYSVLSPDEAVAMEPQLADIRKTIHSAIHYPDDAWGNAHLFATRLAEEAEKLGGCFVGDRTVRALAAEKGKLTGIHTEDGFEPARRVVLAAGARSPLLAKTVGVALPIKPVKGYSLTFDGLPTDALPRMPIIHDSMHAGITPIGGALRIAGTAELAGYSTTCSSARIDNLRRLLRRIYPSLYSQTGDAPSTPWAGLRPTSADGVAFIGETKIEGLWTNTGHGHLGWTLAAGSAHLLATMMTGGAPDIDPAPYDPKR